MAEEVASEYALRTRGEPERRALASLSNKERGLRAAIEVLQDGTSPKSARTKWLVDADCLRYYKNKLKERGAGEGGSSVDSSITTGDSTATSAQQPAAVQSNLSDKRSAWGNYQAAYIYAGKLVNEGKGPTPTRRCAPRPRRTASRRPTASVQPPWPSSAVSARLRSSSG